jgi:hypothetical protein
VRRVAVGLGVVIQTIYSIRFGGSNFMQSG